MKSFIIVRNLILIGLFILGVSSCAGTKDLGSCSKRITIDSLSEDKLMEFKYQFFEANKYFLASNYDMATSVFKSCLKIDPTSSAVHYKLASIYLLKKEFKLAEEHANKAVFYNPDNVWYLYLAGNVYSQNNNIPKAKECFEKLISIDDSEIDFYLNLADVYLKDNDINGALKLYNSIETRFGISEFISLQKHKLYVASNNKKEALNVLISLSESNPQNIEYKRMVADYYLQNNSIVEAIKTYNKILKDYPNDGFSNIGLAECYRKNGDVDKSFEQIKLAFASEDIPSDIKFNLLLNIIQGAGDNIKIQTVSFELTEILVKLYPLDPDINTIYANFLIQKNLLKEAREFLIKVSVVRKDKYAIWEQLVLLDNHFQDWDTMFIHTSEALKYFPNQSFLYFFNGFSAFQLENYEHCIKSLSFGYKLITSNDPLVSDYLTFLGESYYKMGDKEKSYVYFDDIIKNDSDNLMVLNNYAYYLSIDNVSLDKAEKMSKLTITAEPQNPTYLDTYAWILFKQKKYEEALLYIEKCISFDESISDVVFEHYGDILFYNGKKSDAVSQWIKAKDIGEGSGHLEEKIENTFYFEE